jgi:hypothetical protein
VHVTDSRHCAGKTAYDHTLVEDMHINFPIEDYRKEPKWKISKSVAFKAPMCTLFNMSLGPPIRIPLSVRTPLEAIKERAHTLELTHSIGLPKQALGSLKPFELSQAIQHIVDIGFYAPTV